MTRLLKQLMLTLVAFNLSLLIPLPTLAAPVAVDPIVIGPADLHCKTSGCSGEICQSVTAPPINSTCIYKPEFACLKESSCQVQANGQCGWTQTPEYLACLNGDNPPNSSPTPVSSPTPIPHPTDSSPSATPPTSPTAPVCGNHICELNEYVPCPTGAQCIWAGSCPQDCQSEVPPTKITPPVSLTPQPTCLPRPACLDTNPRCLMAEPANSWCPPETPETTPTSTPSATPSQCLPRPLCLDEDPPCLSPEPDSGWCVDLEATPDTHPTLIPLPAVIDQIIAVPQTFINQLMTSLKHRFQYFRFNFIRWQ